ncbi:MAG TPA: helix-turn-helix domain-containing protein [Thermoanaerobacter sp.]|nr:helix-turn-helix domain-containing protein [Thermoanaerobacter sp.]
MKMKLGELIKKYREENKMSLREFAKKAGLSHSYINNLENGIDPRSGKEVMPTIETLKKIAQAMDMELNDLLTQIGYIETDREQSRQWQPELTEKDKKDIAKTLEEWMKDLTSTEGLAFFNGEPVDEETKEYLKDSFEMILKHARLMNKKKYTPKKYRR